MLVYKSVMDNDNGGGGSSYTAGDGIDITNDIISTKQSEEGDIDEIIDVYPQSGNLVSIVNAFNKGDIYSTEERMIGQWIDGKPLYQKVLDVSSYALTNKGITTIQSGLTTIDKLISIEGLLWHESGGFWRGMPQIQDNSTTQNSTPFQFYKSTGEITISTRNSEGASAFSLTYIILQYTKTTDTTISIGEATEYSTDERVVGTWIDGKPIYQKTIELTPTSSGVQIATDVDELIDAPIITRKYSSVDPDLIVTSCGIVAEHTIVFKLMDNILYAVAVSPSKYSAGIAKITVQYTKTTT